MKVTEIFQSGYNREEEGFSTWGGWGGGHGWGGHGWGGWGGHHWGGYGWGGYGHWSSWGGSGGC